MITLLALGIASHRANAANIKVIMNNTSRTMSLATKDEGKSIDVGTPSSSNEYSFEAPAGRYILTGYATDGTTVNGTIELNVTEEASQEFKIITCTIYATNRNTDKSYWSVENGDFTLEVKVNSREGERHNITVGHSTTANRYTFMAFNGNSYYATYTPSDAHRADNYMELYKSGTLTGNISISGAIPTGEDYVVTFPREAEFQLGLKFSHFVDFTPVSPTKTETDGDMTRLTYFLAKGQTYNYRTWMKDGLTQAGYFGMNADASKRIQISFTKEDYAKFNPKTVNHSVEANDGYETGDIFVNINERGHLDLNPGQSYMLHCMRTWELTDNSTNNYFMEPDFHYNIIDLDGHPSTGVIEISSTPTSAWAEIKAVGSGTAIVLVTYDAIGLRYNGSAYMGGEYWGAIWPENTAAFVVTVGQPASAVAPNMLINEKYNLDTKKNAGKFVDAEHDVFYYLDSEPGALYTFTPENAASVSIAYPKIEDVVSYHGFAPEGVTQNQDGSYTLLLKEGRQIVKMTDAAGIATYQVLTAKPCSREITNVTRPGSKIFQPGDRLKIQYSGLRHPANKLAGIYNMSAYVTYNGIPNGSSLILGSGQYTFGSAPSAQAVTVNIPDDMNVDTQPVLTLDEGVIQVNGYGDPIGNHRIIDPVAGRSPNFTAIAHKTYFGAIPEVKINLSPVRTFNISLLCNVSDADITLMFNGAQVKPEADGSYRGTYGTYSVTAVKAGYRCYHNDYVIDDNAEDNITFNIDMTMTPGAWDGKTMTEPATENGVYMIGTPAELAWFAQHVNGGNTTANAALTDNIDLGDYDWTAIGSTSKAYAGTFSGSGHRVDGLYINLPDKDYQGLFGYARGTSASNAHISGITVSGSVTAKRYTAGILGAANQYVSVDTCANYADVTGSGAWIGGVVGQLMQTTATLSDCYNAGKITSPDVHAGVVGGINNNCDNISNVFNVGEISEGKLASACVGSNNAKKRVTNAFAIKHYSNTEGYELVTDEQMASGEIAYRLGKAFGQKIGTDPYPRFGAPEVKYDADNDRYYNDRVDGISDISGSLATPVRYYNLQGMVSTSPWTGLNIVLMSDGTTIKRMY